MQSAFKIQCHVVKNTLLLIALSVILPTGIYYFVAIFLLQDFIRAERYNRCKQGPNSLSISSRLLGNHRYLSVYVRNSNLHCLFISANESSQFLPNNNFHSFKIGFNHDFPLWWPFLFSLNNSLDWLIDQG